MSHPKSGDLLTIDPFELILGKRIEGSWGGGVNPDEHFIEISKKISNNKVFLDMYAMKNYSLEEINQAEYLQEICTQTPNIKIGTQCGVGIYQFKNIGYKWTDGDTVISPGSEKATREAVGSILKAIDSVEQKKYKNAFCVVRPPGG